MRRFFHRIVTRPRLSPGSISAVGRAAFAPVISVWSNSFLMASGQFSASADNGARMKLSAGTCAAGNGIFGAALKSPAAGADEGGVGVARTGGAEKTGLSGARGMAAAGAAGVGATGAGLGAAAMVFGATVGDGVTGVRIAGAGALDGGAGAGLTGA